MSAESTSDDLNRAVELHHRAGDTIMKGSHEGYAELYSRQDDVTLGNPFGPFARGYEDVLRTLQGAASHYRDGEATGFERVLGARDARTCLLRRGRALPRQGWRTR
jgi:hypothetical protein